MEKLQAATEATNQHHLESFGNRDIKETMKDYAEDSEVWTPDGVITGLNAIASFFSDLFTLLPKESTQFESRQQIIKDSKVYLVWAAESAKVNIPFGTDSFEIKNGKIVWQSLALQMTLKAE